MYKHIYVKISTLKEEPIEIIMHSLAMKVKILKKLKYSVLHSLRIQ